MTNRDNAFPNDDEQIKFFLHGFTMPISTILENMGAAYETRYFKNTRLTSVSCWSIADNGAWFGGFRLSFFSFLTLLATNKRWADK